MKKIGTEITVKGGGKFCPRCGHNTYGCTSDTKSYEEGELKAHYQMKKPFCFHCAYVKGDSL